MKIYLHSALLLIGSGLCACGNNNTSDPEFKYDRIQTAQSTNTPINKELFQITSPAINTADRNQTSLLPVSATANLNIATNNLNPAHGLPGHRCDLAVGAPLNNTPVIVPQPAPTVQQPQPVVVSKTQQVINPNTTSAAGINPAHGQPGHRCDIAVGASLSSNPVAAIKQNQPTVVSTKKTEPGMNPPHGKPGHRCDIAVGSPLNKAIVKNDNAVKVPETISAPTKDSTKN